MRSSSMATSPAGASPPSTRPKVWEAMGFHGTAKGHLEIALEGHVSRTSLGTGAGDA